MALPVQPGMSQTQFESLRCVADHIVSIRDRTKDNYEERGKNPNKPSPGRKFEG